MYPQLYRIIRTINHGIKAIPILFIDEPPATAPTTNLIGNGNFLGFVEVA